MGEVSKEMSEKVFQLHPTIAVYLKSLAVNDKLPSTFLFYGPEDVGKLEFALGFCRFLFCRDFPNGPCGECKTCMDIEKGYFPNVEVVDFKETKKGTEKIIDKVRGIKRESSLLPVFVERKVFILDNVEYLSVEAANALLKVLEEPPSWCHFILITQRVHSLLDTILSRCWKIYFGPVPLERAEGFVREEYNLSTEEARKFYSLSEGRVFSIPEFMDKYYVEQQRGILRTFFSSKVPDVKRIDRDQFREMFVSLLRFLKDMVIYKSGKKDSYVFHPLSKEITSIAEALSITEIFGIIDEVFKVLFLWEKINIRLAVINVWEVVQCREK